MSTVVETPVRRPRTTRRAATRSRGAGGVLSGGVLWIVGIAVLLAGVVAINVLALRLTVELDELRRTRAELKAEIATNRAQLSSASANQRIVHDAVTKLGLVQQDPNQTTNLDLETP